MIGETLGSYRILSSIGKGGMGVVYRAEHALIGRKAAIKLLQPEMSRDLELVERFFNEARAAAVVDHPGLVEVFDFGHHSDGRAYIVMELLDGESLAERLARTKRLSVATASAIARQVAVALHAAHEHGIVHRDLKPENIFLIADGDAPQGTRIKVLDFGIAKLAHEETPRSVKTKTGAVFGTPRYMAPEQCKNAGNVDGRADVYALGCILYEMLLGRAPFDYDSWGELVAAHIHETPPRPRELDPSIPPAIERVVMTALAKQIDDRQPSMANLADQLDEVWRASGSDVRPFLVTPPPRSSTTDLARAIAGPRSTREIAKHAPTFPVAAEITSPRPRMTKRWPWAVAAVAAVAVVATAAIAGVVWIGLRGGEAPDQLAGSHPSAGATTPESPTSDRSQPTPESPTSDRADSPTSDRARTTAATTGATTGATTAPTTGPTTTAPTMGATTAATTAPTTGPTTTTPTSPVAATPPPGRTISPLREAPEPPAGSHDAAGSPHGRTDIPVAAAEVRLDVDSLPRGADIYRASDGVKLGKTPLSRVFARTDGNLDLVLKLTGYRDAKISLSTMANASHVEKLVGTRASSRPHKTPSSLPPSSAPRGSGATVLDPYAESP